MFEHLIHKNVAKDPIVSAEKLKSLTNTIDQNDSRLSVISIDLSYKRMLCHTNASLFLICLKLA